MSWSERETSWIRFIWTHTGYYTQTQERYKIFCSVFFLFNECDKQIANSLNYDVSISTLCFFKYLASSFVHNSQLFVHPHQQNMIKAAQSTEKQQNIVKLLEQDKKTLENEINGYRQEAQKQRKIIQQLEKERDRYINETSSLMQKARHRDNKDSSRVWIVFEFCLSLTSDSFLFSTGATKNERCRSSRDGDIWLEEEGHSGRV